MKTFHQILAGLILTPAERTRLKYGRVLRRDENEVLAGYNAPWRWSATDALTEEEAKAWAATLANPVLQKVDRVMNNWLIDQAQMALGAPDVVRQAGFARGMRAGWEMAKTLSRLAPAPGPENEDEEIAALPEDETRNPAA